MKTQAESNLLRKIKLRRLCRQFADGNQSAFGKMLGIDQSQMSVLLGPSKVITDKKWAQIIKVLGIKDVTLPEDEELHKVELNILKSRPHQGRELEEFLRAKKISNTDAAKYMGVSKPSISNYKATTQFQPDVAEKIRNFMSNYGGSMTSSIPNLITELPYIGERDAHINLETARKYTFSTKPDYNIEKAIVVKIETEAMDPQLTKDSDVLAIHVPETKYKYHSGLTVLQYADIISIGDVTSNDLFDKGYITLQRAKDSVIRVAKEDIQNIWKIVLGLNVKY